MRIVFRVEHHIILHVKKLDPAFSAFLLFLVGTMSSRAVGKNISPDLHIYRPERHTKCSYILENDPWGSLDYNRTEEIPD